MTATVNRKVRTNVNIDAEVKGSIIFELKTPNKETARVIDDARKGRNMSRVSLDELRSKVGA